MQKSFGSSPSSKVSACLFGQLIVARIPVGRLGRADEIARGVLFLCDENAGFVTGSTLSINGGQHMY